MLYIYLPYLTLLLYNKISFFFHSSFFKQQILKLKILKSINQLFSQIIPININHFYFHFKLKPSEPSDKSITFSLLLMFIFIYCFNLLIWLFFSLFSTQKFFSYIFLVYYCDNNFLRDKKEGRNKWFFEFSFIF